MSDTPSYDRGPIRSDSSDGPLTEARRLAETSRRRTAWLCAATVLAWAAAVGTAILATSVYFDIRRDAFRVELEFNELHDRYMQEFGVDGRLSFDDLTEEQAQEYRTGYRWISRSYNFARDTAHLAIVLFGVAALLSVWLTIASRRTALRQINASLLSITRELNERLPGAGGEA